MNHKHSIHDSHGRQLRLEPSGLHSYESFQVDVCQLHVHDQTLTGEGLIASPSTVGSDVSEDIGPGAYADQTASLS